MSPAPTVQGKGPGSAQGGVSAPRYGPHSPRAVRMVERWDAEGDAASAHRYLAILSPASSTGWARSPVRASAAPASGGDGRHGVGAAASSDRGGGPSLDGIVVVTDLDGVGTPGARTALAPRGPWSRHGGRRVARGTPCLPPSRSGVVLVRALVGLTCVQLGVASRLALTALVASVAAGRSVDLPSSLCTAGATALAAILSLHHLLLPAMGEPWRRPGGCRQATHLLLAVGLVAGAAAADGVALPRLVSAVHRALALGTLHVLAAVVAVLGVAIVVLVLAVSVGSAKDPARGRGRVRGASLCCWLSLALSPVAQHARARVSV